MGCWNATCNVSRLPIFCGDEIVVIPLIAVSATVTANTSYATDNFVPFSFPIVGKYNDYGGIEDAVITEENDKLIRSYEFYKSNGDGTALTKSKSAMTWKSLSPRNSAGATLILSRPTTR